MADHIVIVDEQGTEHEFPAGFDPQRAANLVRDQALYRLAQAPPHPIPDQAALPLAGLLVGGAAGAGPALAQGATALGNGIGRVLAHPAVGMGLGGYAGYKQGGIPGAIEGAAAGALGSRVIGGKVGMLKSALGVTPEAAPAAKAVERLVLSPAEDAAKQQLLKLAAQRASQTGMAHAAGGSIRDFLIQTLGK